MSHRLGSVIAVSPALVIDKNAGIAMGASRKITFTSAPHATGVKFVMLHFSGADLKAGDKIEINYGYSTDMFTSASGPDFWSRPIKGAVAEIIFTDGGTGTGKANLSEYGRGEGIQNNGGAGGNTNADVFLIDSPYVAPGFFNPNGVCLAGSTASWENVAKLDTAPELNAGLMRNTARSAGMFIEAHGSDLSSCSATLIGPDLILTAAHCVSGGDAIHSGSFTLDYQTNALGNRPVGYNPAFHKLKRIVKSGWTTAPTGGGLNENSGLDYAIVQVEAPPGGFGVPPIPIRADLPALNEEVFVIHHPRGLPKKVSRKPTDSSAQILGFLDTNRILSYACDSDNGSSGSSVFDLSGRIVAVNDWAPGACNNQGQSAWAIAQNITAGDPPPKDVDVMLVFDRSGSMSLAGFSGGKTKIQESREAAALFVDLVRTDRTHRIGLVTFSTAASNPPDFALSAANNANKNTLIGPAKNAGIIGAIATGGNTTIGGGLRKGQQQFPAPVPAANTPAILLLTDGLQNTPPMIDEVEGELANTKLSIIGFGTEASLDGPLLTSLAARHGGIYKRAGDGLSLKKFFVLAFGNIFSTAISSDPIYIFPKDATAAAPIPLNVCGEERITVVLGWENASERLLLSLVTPGGNTITSVMPGVFTSSGDTWMYFRLNLPFAGERDGIWTVQVSRFGGDGEFSAPLPEERFFVTATVDGGPNFFHIKPRRIYYTGDTINPSVVLREPSGHMIENAKVTLQVDVPGEGTGNILTKTGLQPARVIDGDQLDARASTLINLEQAKNALLVTTSTHDFELFDDGDLDGDGTFEPDGVFGNPLKDILKQEGNYTFHAKATYGEGCTGTRETFWTVYASVGIDPGCTKVTTETVATLPDGRQLVRITFKPCDRFGNFVGPGRNGSFTITPQPGSTPSGGATDNGDGSYTQDVVWDPASFDPPRFGISQPDRPPIVVGTPTGGLFSYSVKFLCGLQPNDPCCCGPVSPGTYATEINIHNFHDRDVAIQKHILPLVVAGAVAGREPRFVGRKASDKIVLPPHSATMDDCCRIGELLFGAPRQTAGPLTIGFLEILSPVELQVTAIYTVTNPASGSTSIDVETIQPRKAG